jgi:hypothetical protein
MSDISNGNLLRSWKEIAAYLGVDVRTCHRWEASYGMPVHRAEGGGKRSPVFAYQDEIDGWFRDTFKNGHVTHKPVKGSAWTWVVRLILLAVVLIWSYVFVAKILMRGRPADFHIDGSTLVVVDKQGRELWRHDTGLEDLEPEAYYRAHFQVRDHNQGNILPAIVIKDIDGDGQIETLFAPKRRTDQTGEGWLYCFDHKGRERWPFHADRELRCGGTVYSPDYRIAGFYAHDGDGDGRDEIVVEAYHAPDWPCLLTLLDASGNRLGEYLNAGYLRDVEFCDLDGDGREELLAVGVNKEYRSGCLVVFDTRRISGGSPQSGAFACEGFGPGSELYYAVTPPFDASEALGPYWADLLTIDITANRRIRATSSMGLMYEFGFDLKPLQVTPNDGFKVLHKKLVDEGRISSVPDEAYFRGIREAVRFWNGSDLTAEPTTVRR